MTSATFAIPDNIKEDMKSLAWVNWSELGKETFLKKMEQLEILKKFEKDFEKSELTDRDCIRLGRIAKKSMHKKFLKEAT